MTQTDLIEWAVCHGCEVRKKGKSFAHMFNPQNKERGNIPKARDGHSNLLPMTVCKACLELGIPMPDYALAAHEIYKNVHKQIEEHEQKKVE